MDKPVELRVAERSLRCDGLFLGQLEEASEPALYDLSAPLSSRVASCLAGSFSGRVGERRGGSGGGAEWIAVLGLGKRRDLTPGALATWVRKAISEGEKQGAARLAIGVPAEVVSDPTARSRFLRAVGAAAYRYSRFRSPRPRGKRLNTILIVPPRGERAAFGKTLAAELSVIRGAWTMRDLANTPPNQANPAWMARQAQALAGELGAKIRILGPRELVRRGMQGVLAVGSGSRTPPRLARIEWGTTGPVVALVGKGVTFDTGGISIKPSGGMEDMVYDKSGACMVLGVLRAAAESKVSVRLRAYLPFAENMPDGAAYRPGDILRMANGKTVEITNTDAEGRLLLADALSWASDERPDFVLEFSTLTGACVVALGHEIAGLFTPADALADSLLAASTSSGEGVWRLPLGPQFLEEMRGTHADLRNSGGRWGGASSAAAFLSEFVDPKVRWAHLDIAGPASGGHDAPGPKGSTGFGVALVIDWLREVAGAPRRSSTGVRGRRPSRS